MLQEGAVLVGQERQNSLLHEIARHVIARFQRARGKSTKCRYSPNPTPTKKCLHTFSVMEGSQAENITDYPVTSYLLCPF